ncbi:unnamed protein product [Urochloa humidicola]
MESPSPSTLLLAVFLLLLLAPLLLARELGGPYDEQHVRSPLKLPASLVVDGDGAVVPRRPELDAPPCGVSRPGGPAPPPPKPGHGPHPLQETLLLPCHGAGSSGCVSGRQGPAPPSPEGNAPPHYRRRSGPGADVLGALRAFRDALARYVVVDA